MSRGLRKERRALYGGEAWAMDRMRKAMAKAAEENPKLVKSLTRTKTVFKRLQDFVTAPSKMLGGLLGRFRGHGKSTGKKP